MSDKPGVVVIGRNEGERLKRCLSSLAPHAKTIVYVDSGSTDGSVQWAREHGVNVVELDPKIQFCQARARNAGLVRLLEIDPAAEWVHFLDGDCEMVAGWMDRAVAEMRARPRAGVITGRRRERFPDASIYNRLADMEWDTTVGEVEECLGDMLCRTEALRQIGGFRDELVAGEDVDFAVRIRAAGWKIVRVDADMTLHDAAMTHFRQFWRRWVRSGYGYGLIHGLHRDGPVPVWGGPVRSIWIWGLLFPLFAAAAAAATGGLGAALLAAYPVQGWRVYRHRRLRGDPARHAALYAGACVIGKFALAVGLLRYHRVRLLGRKPPLIEYKGPASGLTTRAGVLHMEIGHAAEPAPACPSGASCAERPV